MIAKNADLLTKREREDYCLYCIFHQLDSYDDPEGCATHGGNINFNILKKTGVCKYKLTKENAEKERDRRRKSAESLIPTVDKIFNDIELIGGYLEGAEGDVREYAIKLIKHVSNKYL